MRSARFAPVLCTLLCTSSGWSVISTPRPARAQPAVQRLDFDTPAQGSVTDYAYHWSPNKDAIAVDFYSRLEVFDLQTLRRMVDLGPPKAAAWVLLGWEPDNRALLVTRLTAGGYAPRRYPVTIYDVAQESFATELPQSRAMQKGEWSPDGRYVALTGLFSGVRVYDARALKLLFEFAREGSMGQKLVWSPDSRSIAAVRVMPDYSEKVVIADVDARTAVAHVSFESGAASLVLWSPDSRHLLVSADVGRGVRLVQRNGATLCEASHPSYLMDAAWSAHGEWLAASTVDGSALVLRAADCAAVLDVKDASHAAPALAWSPEHDMLAVAGQTLHVLDMAGARLLWSAPVSADAVAWSTDGTWLAWLVQNRGAFALPMQAGIEGDAIALAELQPWQVPDSEAATQLQWSKQRLRLHLAGKPGLVRVDFGRLQ